MSWEPPQPNILLSASQPLIGRPCIPPWQQERTASCCGAYTDAAPETYKRAPYLRAPHETQFGLTTWDRQDRPQGVELRNFSQVLNADGSDRTGA